MPKLTLNYCTIVDVQQVDPKPGDNQRKNRKVILHVDEEDLFDMLDHLNPKNTSSTSTCEASPTANPPTS